MIVKKTIPKIVAEYEVIDRMTCDLCPEYREGTSSWAEGMYQVAETTVKIEEGDSFPEGSNTTVLECHICPRCFHEVLVPFLESKGVVLQKKKEQW